MSIKFICYVHGTVTSLLLLSTEFFNTIVSLRWFCNYLFADGLSPVLEVERINAQKNLFVKLNALNLRKSSNSNNLFSNFAVALSFVSIHPLIMWNKRIGKYNAKHFFLIQMAWNTRFKCFLSWIRQWFG